MDPNLQAPAQEVVATVMAPQPISQPVQPPLGLEPNASPLPPKGNKKMLRIFAVVFILLLIIVTSVLYFMTVSKTQSTKSQVNEIIELSPTSTPTPTPEINPADTSDNTLDQDSTVLEQNINNLDSDAASIDSSFTDQQTNLN